MLHILIKNSSKSTSKLMENVEYIAPYFKTSPILLLDFGSDSWKWCNNLLSKQKGFNYDAAAAMALQVQWWWGMNSQL